MSYQEDSIDWQELEEIDKWLDGTVADQYKTQPLAQDWARISKVAEELGEAIQAFIGATGQNPRKGVINTQEEVLDELADVVITGLAAMMHFTKDPYTVRQIIRNKLHRIWKRIPRNDNILFGQ